MSLTTDSAVCPTCANQLEALKKFTTIVADTSDFAAIAAFKPTDATTNPSLILAAATDPKYQDLVDSAVKTAQGLPLSKRNRLQAALELVFVNFGEAILKIIPGRVSVEVDAKDSFDTRKSVEKARRLVRLFEERKISKERLLIKLASTWEGIQAAKILEKENIRCNLTLLFSLPQAIAAAQAHATLISPFVGRILDWHLKNAPQTFLPHEDPGVISLKAIFNYYKKFSLPTEIMGASFRNAGQILELAGCDLLTISPALLETLQKQTDPISLKLSQADALKLPLKPQKINEKKFRYLLNADPMASDKLAEGIRRFVLDLEKLETLLKARI
ncbi:MAG: transaldolase [Parachlamydiales bacterium]|jgi:transaldolase